MRTTCTISQKVKVLRQSHVKYLSRLFANHTTGVVCPSERVIDTLRGYGVVTPLRVIPTGIDIEKFKRADITNEDIEKLRQSLHIEKGSTNDPLVESDFL